MENENPEIDSGISEDGENRNSISADLIRGHINTIILRTLNERDKYGYEIIEEIEKKSHGQYTLKQPTLYSALKRLESQGYINAYWKTDEISQGGRRKYYTLTDSGREITDKNRAEWEYSRTVIDSLISDRSFDFSQPAPSAVDFKLLKKSTSRVPAVRQEEEEAGETEAQAADKAAAADELAPSSVPAENAEEKQPEPEGQPSMHVTEQTVQADEEQRRILHENYLKLISEPVPDKKSQSDTVPAADGIDTEKLMYNNKPETERDYRNLINNLFVRTTSPVTAQRTQYAETRSTADIRTQPSVTVRYEDVSVKAENDGLKIDSSDYKITGAHRRSYTRGGALLKSSLTVAIVMMVEFILTFVFKDNMHTTIAYPIVILALGVAQLMIFGVLYNTDFGRHSRRPLSAFYLRVTIVITIILILLIIVVAFLLSINFTSTGDIMAKLVVPCIVALNVPLFSVMFYLFSKKL